MLCSVKAVSHSMALLQRVDEGQILNPLEVCNIGGSKWFAVFQGCCCD